MVKGYDDIPKEIPDPDAKEVIDLNFLSKVRNCIFDDVKEMYEIKFLCFGSQKTGMMKKMGNGLLQPSQILNTRDPGSQRSENIFITRLLPSRRQNSDYLSSCIAEN